MARIQPVDLGVDPGDVDQGMRVQLGVGAIRLRIAFHNQCRSCMAIRYHDAIDDAVYDDLRRYFTEGELVEIGLDCARRRRRLPHRDVDVTDDLDDRPSYDDVPRRGRPPRRSSSRDPRIFARTKHRGSRSSRSSL